MKSMIERMAEIMPSIRAEIAKELFNSHNLNQLEIAELIGVSQPAVSQYLGQMRGKNRKVYNEAARQEIKNTCGKIINGKINRSQLEEELYRICRLVLENK